MPCERVILESPLIKIADGNIINADKIESLRGFRRKLLDLLLGEQISHNQRKGKYLFNGTCQSIESLAQIEKEYKEGKLRKEAGLHSFEIALQEILTLAKADFIVLSSKFIESGRGSKNIMVVLIEEDCRKRNRPNSHLLEWARTKDGQESTMFGQRINSFVDYYNFLTDLANFLLDLIHSCPKAELQFKNRVEKWTVVKSLLPSIVKKARIKLDTINEIDFLKYLKERYLDSIEIEEIILETITPLLIEYMKHANNNG